MEREAIDRWHTSAGGVEAIFRQKALQPHVAFIGQQWNSLVLLPVAEKVHVDWIEKHAAFVKRTLAPWLQA